MQMSNMSGVDVKGFGNKLFKYKLVTVHRNLKGESVVAAILPSRMEGSYCTDGFFRS